MSGGQSVQVLGYFTNKFPVQALTLDIDSRFKAMEDNVQAAVSKAKRISAFIESILGTVTATRNDMASLQTDV